MVVEEFGLEEEELGLEEEEEQKTNEDVFSSNIRKTIDRRRALGHEFEPSPDVDALRPQSWPAFHHRALQPA